MHRIGKFFIKLFKYAGIAVAVYFALNILLAWL